MSSYNKNGFLKNHKYQTQFDVDNDNIFMLYSFESAIWI